MPQKEQSSINFYDIQIKNIMTRVKKDTSYIDKTTDIANVLARFKNKGHVWVMDSTDPSLLVGIITPSDLLAFFSPPFSSDESFEKPDSRSMQYGETITAENIMSKKPVTVTPRETIREVLVIMKEQKIKHLPILDDSNHLIGEVSLSEIIQEYTKYLNQSSKNIIGETQ
jgi:CBS domain-containing protein